MKEGPCTENKPAWYFDYKTGQCSGFTYGGCEGNANRFQSEEQCQRQCGKFKNQDVCSFEKDFGPCLGRFKKYFYNQNLNLCEEFTFGGCEGNGNRFSSITECEQICLTKEEPEIEAPSAISKKAICNLEFDTGLDSCDDQLRRWFFDSQSGTCSAFIYSGCAGNQNRFKTFEVCMGFCEGAGTGVAPPGGAPAPQQPGDQYSPPTDWNRPPEEENYPAPPAQQEQELEEVDCTASEERCSYAKTSCRWGVLR